MTSTAIQLARFLTKIMIRNKYFIVTFNLQIKFKKSIMTLIIFKFNFKKSYLNIRKALLYFDYLLTNHLFYDLYPIKKYIEIFVFLINLTKLLHNALLIVFFF